MSLREQLIYAVRSKDNEKLSNVLDQMTADEANEKGEDGLSALNVAYLTDNIQAMNLILDKPGFSVNTKIGDGNTILAMKCFSDSHEDVTHLLEAPDIDLNSKDDNGRTPVFHTVVNCNIKTLEVMLESSHVDLDVKCDRGRRLEDYVGMVRGSEEEKKKCLDMIREEKMKRMRVSESEGSKGKDTEIEKMKRVNLREESDKNCFIDAKDGSDFVKKSPDLATTEKPSFKLARIVFDASDMGKGFKTLRLNAATPMTEIKKLFPKHLGVDEETFKMCFNNQEVKEETPLELFGSNLDGEDNVISIVKVVGGDQGAFCDKLESSHPEKEADHSLASNAQNGQKEGNAQKNAKRISFKWLGSKMTSQPTQPVRIKPKCIRASCRNQARHRCIRCKAVSYCQHECQSEDWSNHKVHCDYVFKGSKDYAYEGSKDYVCEEKSVPRTCANDDPEEAENSGVTLEEVD